MRIRQLQTFCDLARTLNFTHTAQRLHYAQSSVMEQIEGLEQHFGMPLFARDGRRLALTEHGKALLEDAERIVSLAASARSRLRGESPDAAVTVMAPETFCARRLPPLLRDYQPGRVDVRVGDRATLRRGVADALADVTIMLGLPGGTETPPPGIEAAVLGEEALLPVAAAGHPLAGRTVTLADVAGFALYATPEGCAFRAASDAALAPLALRPSIVSASLATLVAAVASTQGVALLPELAVDDALADGRLAALDVADACWPAVPVLMQWRTTAGPHVRRFVALARAANPA
jgi:DNA-binding transcriptional LysR family regulator